MIRDPEALLPPVLPRVSPCVYPASWNFLVPNGAEGGATAYAYFPQRPGRSISQGRENQLGWSNCPFARLCTPVSSSAKVDKRQAQGVWPHRGGVNAGYCDGSVRRSG